MSWTTMHYAVGMGCTGAVAGAACLWLRKGWRWLPAAMTAGGVLALVPDMPRVFREDFPNAPFAALLGSKSLERWLHSIGDLFFFHRSLDHQPFEYALHGFAAVLILYNLSIVMLMWMEHRQRNSIGNRAWRAHRPHLRKRRQRSDNPPPPQADPNKPAAGRLRASRPTPTS